MPRSIPSWLVWGRFGTAGLSSPPSTRPVALRQAFRPSRHVGKPQAVPFPLPLRAASILAPIQYRIQNIGSKIPCGFDFGSGRISTLPTAYIYNGWCPLTFGVLSRRKYSSNIPDNKETRLRQAVGKDIKPGQSRTDGETRHGNPSTDNTSRAESQAGSLAASVSKYLHLPKLPHRPTKEELLSAANGFWERMRVRFKWMSIRSMRPWNADEWGAFVSWFLFGHIVWILVGTTTFFSLLILSINTVFAQGPSRLRFILPFYTNGPKKRSRSGLETT